ncbi:hypothetical protein MRB53_033801 [Persea americana]|uniref:Uncharacterized protein n=1 Tax=Persea americana TaxID=3435 RepID=A0ACC2KVI2_PERAE|nr:hypothetical protein MRB53_033801 [Persea americana]
MTDCNTKNETALSSASSDSNVQVEAAKNRCKSVRDRIKMLPLSKINDSCKQTLIKLVDSELRFLSRLSLTPDFSGPISSNVGYIESVVYILQHPFVNGVSRVCKHVPLPSPHGKKCQPCSDSVHVDIVCTFDSSPVWFIVSDRNPKYISWLDTHRNKGLRRRVEKVLRAAWTTLALKPLSIVLFFSNGLNEVVAQKLRDEFGALDFEIKFSLDFNSYLEVDGDWVYVDARDKPSVFQINVEYTEKRVLTSDVACVDPFTASANLDLCEEQWGLLSIDAFCSLISTMRPALMDVAAAKPESMLGENLINFDTTALVALVSGISNGCAEKLLLATENEMRRSFKNNSEFVMAQVKSEIEYPIIETLRSVISGKRGIICESVHSEFKELISMYGGPREKSRSDQLLKRLLITPNNPSERLISLPTSRKIAMKNKIIFGTGDNWRAPTLTANMGFVRAILQTGMSLLTLEHRPCALIGD